MTSRRFTFSEPIHPSFRVGQLFGVGAHEPTSGVWRITRISDDRMAVWARRRWPKAADISTLAALRVVERRSREGRWTLVGDLEREFSGMPYKVVLAKVRTLIRNGHVDGCGCGCRGDLVMQDKGWQALGYEEQPEGTYPNIYARGSS